MDIFKKLRRSMSVSGIAAGNKWRELCGSRPGLDIMARIEHPERGLLATGRVVNGRVSAGDMLTGQDGTEYRVEQIELLRYGVPAPSRFVGSAGLGEDVALALSGGSRQALDGTREILLLEPGDI